MATGSSRFVRVALSLGLLLGGTPNEAGGTAAVRSAVADASGARAAAASFPLATTSSLWLEGSTNINRFRCRSDALDAAVELDAPRAAVLAALERFESERPGAASGGPAALPAPRFRLALPVVELDCASRGLERDLRAALEADRYPAIVFELVDVTGVERAAVVGGGGEPRHRLDLRGALTLRDRRRDVETTIWATRSSPTRYRLTGELPLRMTDFGISPPVVLFGLIRVKDELRLRFDVEIELGTGAADARWASR